MSVFLALALSAAPPPAKSEALALQQLHNFGECVVKMTPDGAEQALAMDFRTDDYAQKLKAYAKGHGRCLAPAGDFKASGILFAGSLAEALLHSKTKPSELAQQLAFDPQRAAIDARSETETMALCTAMQAPQATSELLQTEPASSEEHDVMIHVVAVLPNCLKKDSSLTMNPPALRALLALAAWRIVDTPKVAAQ